GPSVKMPGGIPRFFRWVPLCIFCGAPLFALVTRSALGGAILSVVVPGCCLTLATLIYLVFPALSEPAISSTLLVVWCPLAVALGWVQWRSHQARAPKSFASWSTSSPRSGPLVALLRKEVRLQYGTFAVAIPLWSLFFVGGVL